MKETLKAIKGFSRVQLEESGKIVGDSGWQGPNTVADLGFKYYLAYALLYAGNRIPVLYSMLGTGTAPNASHTSLPSEIFNANLGDLRKAVTSSMSGSHSCVYYVTFYGSEFTHTNSNSLPKVIQNIGLCNEVYSTATGVGYNLFCGNTYATSSWATNQNCNATYQISFS